MSKVRLIVLNFILILNFIFLKNILPFYTGAGVLPYCEKDGTILFLFAQDSLSKNFEWGDFGGNTEYDYLDSALKYFYQGTYGLLTHQRLDPFDLSYMEQVFKDLKKIDFHDLTFNYWKGYYHLLLFKVDYVPADILLEKRNFCEKNIFYSTKYSRIIGYSWVDIKDLVKSIKILKRLNRENLVLDTKEIAYIFEKSIFKNQKYTNQADYKISVNKFFTSYLLTDIFMTCLDGLI